MPDIGFMEGKGPYSVPARVTLFSWKRRGGNAPSMRQHEQCCPNGMGRRGWRGGVGSPFYAPWCADEVEIDAWYLALDVSGWGLGRAPAPILCQLE